MVIPMRETTLAITLTAASVAAQGFHLDYMPTQREVVLNTDSTVITPVNSPPIRVVGGVFQFRNVTIPQGVLVRGEGSRPMVWIVWGDFVVDGKLSVRGGDGARVDTLNSANFPTRGGTGNCGGGDGGRGSPNSTDRSFAGENGLGPSQLPRFGGQGGALSCTPSCGRGAGGGGGVFATAGDPYYPPNAIQRWTQVSGHGGERCLNKSLPGGRPGVSPFLDGRDDNDFFGLGIDFNRRAFVPGELPVPIGGQGGGGGGDRSLRCGSNDPGFVSDNKGGGGGGGGGVLVILAHGTIRVGATGWICADGGHGGGGEQAGSNNQGGGGAGGSGGMVIALAEKAIEVQAHGETYGRGDYGFAISADGGIGKQGRFASPEIVTKYPPGAPTWATNPAGGFGGLGVVELIAPLGTNTDGTNTVLDDNIHVLRGAQRLTGAEKQRYLAWRGYPDGNGVWSDDGGKPTDIGDNEGDIRPSPILVPLFK